MKLLSVIATTWAALVSSVALGQAPAVDGIMSVTRHQGTFNGKHLAYSAAVERTILPDAAGKPSASFVSFAYTQEGVKDPATRPVIFLFNGGPGSSSIFLHLGGMGPQRLVMPATPDDGMLPPYRLEENQRAVLDVADLVFLDPPNAGLSRTVPDSDSREYYSVEADTRAMLSVIKRWIDRHGRRESPKYVIGESYGTIRAVTLARDAMKEDEPIAFAGLVLLGPSIKSGAVSWRINVNVVPYAVNISAMTATAWYYERIDRRGRSLAEAVDDASRFAQTEYIAALMQGSDLPPAQTAAIAQRLNELTGIEASYFRDHQLMLNMDDFRSLLLATKHQVMGLYDSRFHAKAPEPWLGDHMVEPSLAFILPGLSSSLKVYLSRTLGVPDAGSYVIMDPNASNHWTDHRGYEMPSEYGSALSEAMKSNAEMRVMFVTGYYDLTTPVASTAYTIAHSDLPVNRTISKYYPSGHMTYFDDVSLTQLSRDLREFVR